MHDPSVTSQQIGTQSLRFYLSETNISTLRYVDSEYIYLPAPADQLVCVCAVVVVAATADVAADVAATRGDQEG